jgi:lysophospholipase L1-like esterase
MSVIVCFGDSNTWGYDPAAGTRLSRDARWTGVLQHELGSDHQVIEEGLNGRTTVFDDPIEPGRRGADYLPACLLSHKPLDLLIIALGCNDLKARFGVPPSDVAAGVERLIEIARAAPVSPTEGPPAILIVAPPPLAKLTGFAEMFAGGTEKSHALAARYAEVAEHCGVGFVDAGQFIHCSDLDGIHFEADQHAVLGRVMAEAARMLLAAL